MLVTKYPQSHLVLEKDNKKILIDPGNLTFENGFKIEDFLDIDAFFITHIHNDHMGYDTIKDLVKNKPVYGNSEVVDKLKELGVEGVILENRQQKVVAGFEIEAVELPHFRIPGGEPKNTGFLIDGVFFHGGDGYKIEQPIDVDNAALAIGHPALSLLGVLDFAKHLNAKKLIPIHYDKYPRNIDELKSTAESYGIHIKILELNIGESTQV